MRTMTLDEVRQAVRGRWLARGPHKPLSGVSTDTRSASKGDIFFALRGARTDGHLYLAQAAEAGCAAAVVAMDANASPEALAGFEAGVVGATDTTVALGDLAAVHRSQVSAPTVVGVTGSNGKTTVRRMIHHILSRRLMGTQSPKSFNNHIGVPLTLLGVSPSDDYVVCEIGTSAPGEIAALSKIARPDVAVITSIGPAHLEKLGSVERVAVEKASILAFLAEAGLGVIWADSEILSRAVRPYRCKLIRFGESPEADIRMTGYATFGLRQEFQINGRLWVSLSVAGKHNAINAMAAIATAQRFGIAPEDSAEALADFRAQAMRLQWQPVGDGVLINDAYNANPSSMAAAVEVLAGAAQQRKVFIAGDMLELGPAGPELHERLGSAAAQKGIDLVIGVGPLGRHVASGAADGGAETARFDSVVAAADAAGELIRPGDAVLVKGSRGMGMEQLAPSITAALDSGESAPIGEEGEGPER